jgi:hypothetical protein
VTTRRTSFRVEQFCAAPASVVWEVLDDVPGWPTWMPGVTAARWECQGAGGPSGPGAIRSMTTRGLTAREQITAATPPRRQCYAMLSGLPVRDYLGEISLDERDDGSLLTWQASFHPRAPGTGWLLRLVMSTSIGRVAAALAREAERRAAKS